MPTKRIDRVSRAADLARKEGVVRLRELEAAGIPKAVVLRACESGQLERVGRGLYTLPGREVTESEALVQVAADCLKYRNKLGRDIAVAALRDYRPSRRSIDELFGAARVCRVEQTLRTYLEVMG